MNPLLLINVDELWLKGQNRPQYFDQLKQHVRNVLSAYGHKGVSLQNLSQRLLVRMDKDFESSLVERLAKIAGIHDIRMAFEVHCENHDDIFQKLEQLILNHESFKRFRDDCESRQRVTFRVQTKRVNKKYPLNSMEFSRQLGSVLLKRFPALKVQLSQADWTFDMSLYNQVFLSLEKTLAIGGLPVGSSGRLLTLLSGGFDSPVASYLMSKRGCAQDFVFFHAKPFVGDEVVDKIKALSSILATYQNQCRLFIVPFGELQKLIAKTCHEEYRTLFFRKFMLEAASLLSQKTEAHALCTGDSLGQVSSQAMGNMTVLDQFCPSMVLRPLVGFNKREIIQLAKEIGTHDTSVLPHDDACGLFAPAHPIIRPKLEYCRRYFERNSFSQELSNALEKTQVIAFGHKGEELALEED